VNQDEIDQLLEKCLAAYDAGLTPEECLASWPGQRDALEPLLRQALLLRVAYATTPSEEFRDRVRAKLMFRAGREVRQALAAEPDPEFRDRLHSKVMFVAGREARQAYEMKPDPAFVTRTRNRLRYAAGEAAQEALRAVPPPRLAFWSNARRRLLESATSPRRQTTPRAVALTMRAGLSAAVLVLALSLAGVLYLTSRGHPSAASAELASLDQQVHQIEQLAAAGVPVQADTLAELSGRTLTLAGTVNTDQSLAPLADKLQPLIDRQQEVVNRVAPDSSTRPPALREVQQQLSQAEQQVRIAAARSELPPAPQQQATIAPAATLQPSATAGLPPPTTVPLLPGLLGPNLVRITALPNDHTFDLPWGEIATDRFRATIPANWTLVGLTPNAIGLAGLEQPRITLYGPAGVIVLLDTSTGEIDALANGQLLVLKERGATGKPIAVTEIVAKAAPVARELSHIAETAAFAGPAAAPVLPSATPTAIATATSTAPTAPTATSTATPPPSPTR